jgi:hypothetical protein
LCKVPSSHSVNAGRYPTEAKSNSEHRDVTFHTHLDADYSLDIDYSVRDESRGVIGQLKTNPTPYAAAESRDEMVTAAYAAVGRDPTVTVLVTDSEGFVFERISCAQFHRNADAYSQSVFVAWACFGFSFIAFCVASIFGVPIAGLLWTVIFVMVYVPMVRTGFMNEIESAIVAFLIATLVVLAIPALNAAYLAWIQLQNGG